MEGRESPPQELSRRKASQMGPLRKVLQLFFFRPVLANVFIASVTISGQRESGYADEFIRQPARNQASVLTPQPKPTMPNGESTSTEVTATTASTSASPSVTLTAAQHAPPGGVVMLEPQTAEVHAMPYTPTSNTGRDAISREGLTRDDIYRSATSNVTTWLPRNGRPHTSSSLHPSVGSTAFSNNTSVNNNPAEFRDHRLDQAGLPEVPPAAYQYSGSRYAVHTSPEREAAIAEQKARKELAAKISNEIMVGNKWDDPSMSSEVGSLESAPGWQAVREQLKRHIDRCESLLSRKAHLSAIEEAHQGVIMLARVLDLRQNKLTSEPAWGAAQQALREALEFTSITRIANDSVLFKRVIQAHETPALKNAEVSHMTPMAAAQHYLAYAEVQLVEASQGHPWFSELYYCIGRALQMQAEENQWQSHALLQQALTYYRSANAIQPTNSTNSNQMGYVLLKMDRPTEALEQLLATINQPDCPVAAWQNLVQASSRLGDARTEQWAMQNYLALKARLNEPNGPTATLVEVDPKQFAALSPYTSGPRALSPVGQYGSNSIGTATGQPNPAMVPTPAPPLPSAPTPAAPARTAKTPWSGLFR